jgi:GNAT superfamily N-acetyltransferase
LHARPQGAILLAREAGTPLGCVMYSGLEDGSAEAKRLFVSTQARGKGVGGALVKAMLEHARADGYSVMVLDTARFLTAAQRLYHLAGFVDVQPPAGVPAPLRDVAIFMRKELQGSYSP